LCRSALCVQRFDRRLRVRRNDLEQRSGRAGWPVSMLLPVLQRAQVDSNQSGELCLADSGGLADGTHVGFGRLRGTDAAYGLAGHVALHFAHAFDQLIEMPLIHP
jgi:hypothetical protein